MSISAWAKYLFSFQMVEESHDGSSDSHRPMPEASGGSLASTMEFRDTESTFVPLNRHHYEEDTSSVL